MFLIFSPRSQHSVEPFGCGHTNKFLAMLPFIAFNEVFGEDIGGLFVSLDVFELHRMIFDGFLDNAQIQLVRPLNMSKLVAETFPKNFDCCCIVFFDSQLDRAAK